MLKAAVVGVGYLGRFHAQKLNAHQQVKLVGVTDFNFSQAEVVASELQTKAFDSLDRLALEVDYVHIAASTLAHYDLAKFFLEKKIPVLLEKPIAATVQQAEALCELAEKNKVLFTVGHIERFNPAFKYLKENYGKASYLEINRLAPFRVRGSDVSVIHDLTIHDIDLVNWIFKSEIVSVQGSFKKIIKPTVDDVSLRLTLKNNTQVTINNSRISPQIIRNYRAVDADKTVFVNTATLEGEVLTKTSADPFHQIEKITLEKVDSLALEADHFVQCLLGKKSLMITAKEATKALKQVEHFVAMAEGVTVEN